ncbi:hypothetical protein V8E36_003928 [Tilletia maclaganii]
MASQSKVKTLSSAVTVDAETTAAFKTLIVELTNPANLDSLISIVDTFEDRVREESEEQDASGSGSGSTPAQGIPLLALKTNTLLSYIHHLVILTAHRMRGGDLTSQPGAALVENLIRLRLVLDKARPLEGKLRYQIDKAVRAAEEEERGPSAVKARKGKGRAEENGDGSGGDDDDDDDDDDEIDPLAFRPNPAALLAASKQASSSSHKASASASAPSSKPTMRTSKSRNGDDDDDEERGGVYRPPKLAPVPYDPDSISRHGGSREDRLAAKEGKLAGKRNAALLADLSLGLSSNPYELSSAGLGGAGRNAASSAQGSARARALRRMEEYEEENFTRLVMKKKDAKRRRRDEEAVALGGAGLDSANRRQGRLGAGLDEEFGDLLRGSGGGGTKRKAGGGKRGAPAGDAYDSLRSSSVKRAKVSGETLSGSSSSSSNPRDLFRSGKSGGGRGAQSQFSKDVARSRKKARQ